MEHCRSLKWFARPSNKSKVSDFRNRYKYVKGNSFFWRSVSSSFKWNKCTYSNSTSLPANKYSSSGVYSKFSGSQTYNTGINRGRPYHYTRGRYCLIIPDRGFPHHKDKLCYKGIPSSSVTRVLENHSNSLPCNSNVLISKTSRFSYIKPGSSACSSSVCKENFKVVTRFSIKKMIQRNVPRSSTHQYKKIVRKAVHSLKFRRHMVCQSYCRTGSCSALPCSYSHDKNYLRICPRFLQQSCSLGSGSCPLAHVLDPCRLPQCTYYESGKCERVNCPYLHVRHPPKTAVCLKFSLGRCPLGRMCNKRHIWLHTSFSSKSSHQKTKRTFASRSLCETFPPKQENTFDYDHSSPTTAPAGSLRNVYPPPEFIPLISDNDDFMTPTDTNCS
ncbi:unnamed protein product [Schistosoma turkestanicum]|nr:unnamed protein product [Schistosoma turkestanicum]